MYYIGYQLVLEIFLNLVTADIGYIGWYLIAQNDLFHKHAQS